MSKATDGEGQHSSTEGRAGLIVALAVLVLLPVLFYGSMVFSGLEPNAPDTGASQPFGIWGNNVVQQTGHVPLWYPYIFAGMPSYGSLMYTPRSPVNPVALLQSMVRENRGAYYALLLIVAGLAGFAFLRRQGFSRVASTTAALVFSLTPYFPGCVAAGHSTKIEALCLLPVFLLSLDLFLDRPDLLRCAFLAAAGALLAWSSHPQVAFYGLFVGLLYGLGVLLFERRKTWIRADWSRLAIFLVVAVFLSLAMVAEPYLAVKEYTPYSIRGGGVTEGAAASAGGGGVGWPYATAWSFHPVEMISFLFPGWFGLEGDAYWGKMPFTQSTHYFGILALGLAIFGLVASSGKRRRLWGVISGVVLLVGFGRYLPIFYGPMYYVLPFFNKFRVPSMIYSLLPLCLGYLVAAGMDALLQRADDWARARESAGSAPPRAAKGKGKAVSGGGPAPARALLIAILIAAACWAVLAVGARANLDHLGRPEELAQMDPSSLSAVTAVHNTILQRSVAQGMLLVLAALGLLLLAGVGLWPRKRIAPWLGAALAVLTVGDLFVVGREFYHVGPRVEAKKTAPLAGAADFLSGQPGLFRILPLSVQQKGVDLINSNSYGLYHLESITGYQPAKLKAYQDLLGANLLLHPGVLEMLNVRYLLSSGPVRLGQEPLYQGDGYVYPYPDSLPRAWAVKIIRKVNDTPEMLRLLGDDGFRPRDLALVYAAAAPPSERYAPATVSVLDHGLGSLRLHVQAEGPAFVAISEISFPPGWRATVNGAPTRIYRVDHVLQGVEVPAGESEVRLTFTSPARQRGVLVSRAAAGATLLLAAAGWLLQRRRRAA